MRPIQDAKSDDINITGWRRCEKSITFAGGTPNAIGDFDGTGEPFNIFTVTGLVEAKIIGLCTTTLTIDPTATCEVGTAILDDGIIATTAGDAIDVNEIWHDATPDSSIEAIAGLIDNMVSQSVIGTTKTANILTGVIKFICIWRPLTKDGAVTAA